MRNIDKIKFIATKVRKQCEDFAMSDEAQHYDFAHSRTLACMCAVASSALKQALNRDGIEAELIHGYYKEDEHCWVESHNHIIDITATQFRLPRVYIIPSPDIRYNKQMIVKEYSYFFRRWEGQRPNERVVKKILDNY